MFYRSCNVKLTQCVKAVSCCPYYVVILKRNLGQRLKEQRLKIATNQNLFAFLSDQQLVPAFGVGDVVVENDIIVFLITTSPTHLLMYDVTVDVYSFLKINVVLLGVRTFLNMCRSVHHKVNKCCLGEVLRSKLTCWYTKK